MYAEKLVFENNSYQTPTYREELALILNGGAGSSGNKKGQNQENLILSSQVVPGGQISNWVVLWFKELYEKLAKNA